MEIVVFNSIDELLAYKSDVALIDFGGASLSGYEGKEMLFIGPEGGFSQNERDKIGIKFALNSPYILRSNSAIIGVASKILI